jgi:hypothetical protein
MKRLLAAVATIALVPIALGAGSIAVAQTDSSYKLGIQQLNNSGQIGTVNLIKRGNKTLVTVAIDGAPGKPEAVTIHRGSDCDNVSVEATWRLNDASHGRSSTLVDAPLARLISGNYSLLVYGGTSASSHAVACGHLFNS